MAQTTTHINACDAAIWLDDDGGVLRDISGSSNRVEMAFSRQMLTFRTESEEWLTRQGNEMDLRVGLKVVYSTAGDEAFDILKRWYFAGSGLRSMHVYTGNDHYYGEFILKDLDIPAGVGEPGPIPVSAFLLVDGEVSIDEIDWFVDSVTGNDAYDGRSAGEAFLTFAAVEAVVSAGESIGLARGSHWRGQLDITDNNVTIRAYGSGTDPLLDASNVAANASFAKTGGRANVYEISITPEWWGGGKDWINVWEDDDSFTRAADVAGCDATPGSYFPSAEGAGAVTLYVHASDSSDVTTNGYVYEYTHRKHGLDTRNATGVTIRGLIIRRNLHVDGSLRVGPAGSVYDTYCDDGSSHNILFETGAYLYNVEARNSYHTGSQNMFVGNSDSPAAEGLTLVDCTASQDAYNSLAIGFYCHYNVAGTFGAVSLTGCSAVNLGLAYTMQHSDSYALTECTSTGTKQFMRDWSTNAYTMTDCAYTYTGANGRVLDGQAAGTRTFIRMTAVADDPGSGIFYSAQAIDLILTDCDITNNDAVAANAVFVYLSNAGATLAASGTDYKSPNRATGPYVYYFPNDLAALDSDYNCFGDADQWFWVGAGNYGTVAAYQAGTGEDSNSTVGGC